VLAVGGGGIMFYGRAQSRINHSEAPYQRKAGALFSYA